MSNSKVLAIEGNGVQMRFAKINKKIFDRVTKNGISDDELHELVDDGDVEGGALFPLIQGDHDIWCPGSAKLGFDNGINKESVEINYKIQSQLLIPPKVEITMLPDAEYLLVLLEDMVGVWAAWELESCFDPSLLDISLGLEKLCPDILFSMLSIEYNGDDGTSGMDLNCTDTTVLARGKDGNCVAVEFL